MNKKIALLFLLTLFSVNEHFAQNIEVNIADKAQGTKYIKTSNHVGEPDMSDSVAKHGVLFFSAGYQAANEIETYFIDLEIVHNDNRLGCLREKESRIILSLADGSEMECFQISETDCDKLTYHGVFALMPNGSLPADMAKNFEKLKTTEIEELKVLTSEGELIYKIKPKEKAKIKSHFALLEKTINAGMAAK